MVHVLPAVAVPALLHRCAYLIMKIIFVKNKYVVLMELNPSVPHSNQMVLVAVQPVVKKAVLLIVQLTMIMVSAKNKAVVPATSTLWHTKIKTELLMYAALLIFHLSAKKRELTVIVKKQDAAVENIMKLNHMMMVLINNKYVVGKQKSLIVGFTKMEYVHM